MPWFKIGAGVAGLLAVLALVVAVQKLVAHERHVHANSAAYDACKGAVGGGLTTAETLGKACAPNIAAAALRAARSAACDAALASAPADAFGVQQACSAPVKHLVAERDARAEESAGFEREVSRLKASRDADIARAEARASILARRKAHAEDVLRTLPAAADGTRNCDAGCLRALADGAASP